MRDRAHPNWTKEEDIALTSFYPLKVSLASQHLPLRSVTAKRARAAVLGLRRHPRRPRGTCRDCGELLTEANHYESSAVRSDYICKACIMRRNALLKQSNSHVRDWFRNNALHTSDVKYVVVRKRPRPDDSKCELCGRVKTLVYHHYGPVTRAQYLPGMWVCRYCHPFAELFDKGYAETYVAKKELILNGNTSTH